MSVVGIRELKSGLSKYLKRVAAGERITVTERGHPVAVLIPVDRPLSAPLQAMIAAGTARWTGGGTAWIFTTGATTVGAVGRADDR